MGVIRDKAARARDLLLPWSGLLGGSFGWFITQQVGSTQGFDHCGHSGAVPIILTGICGLVLALWGCWLASQVRRDRSPSHGARRFIAVTGIGIAALFVTAIILQTAAALIIPRCFG